MKKLKSNQVIAILPDQEPAEGSGKFVAFFKRPAYTMTLLSQLAVKTQCVVLQGVAIRQPNGQGFAIEFSKVSEEINNTDREMSLNELNHCIESIVRANPEQYQWEYKRFKKAPDQTKGLY